MLEHPLYLNPSMDNNNEKVVSLKKKKKSNFFYFQVEKPDAAGGGCRISRGAAFAVSGINFVRRRIPPLSG
jgi:hypothetical protein